MLAALDAFHARDLVALEKLLPRTAGTLLADYPQLWWLELRLGTALRNVAPAEVHAFLAHAGDGPLADRLRADWLKALAQQQAWTELLQDGRGYSGNDSEVLCGLSSARQLAGLPDPVEALRPAWLSGRATTPTCAPVFSRLLASGQLGVPDILARLDLALQADNVTLARTLVAFLPAEPGFPDAAWNAIAADPVTWLQRVDRPAGLTSAVQQRVLLFALQRSARQDPVHARQQWERLAGSLPVNVRVQGWARIGHQAMQKLDPAALADFRHCAEPLPAPGIAVAFADSELESWARAALRAGSWDDLLQAETRMGETLASQPVWRYWQARALKAQGRREEAQALLLPLAREFDFYGQLAQEELGQRPVLPAGRSADPEEVAILRNRPGIQRAIALFRLGLQPDGSKEWAYVLKGAGERQLLAAAELARQVTWYDRMISSAERAGAAAEPALRYPAPYRELFRARAREQGLDEAWVYGLVRQESRFLADARSRVGAAGLMQLMPATARWVAGRMHLHDFRPTRVGEVEINLQLGTYYLRHVLEDLGQPVLATAAYNAGPGRVRRWLEARPLEGAIFCETIPVAETRDYVKKVMANANLYAGRLGVPARSLHARLGTVRAAGGLPPVEIGDPDAPREAVLPTTSGTGSATAAAGSPGVNGPALTTPANTLPANTLPAGALPSGAAALAPASSRPVLNTETPEDPFLGAP